MTMGCNCSKQPQPLGRPKPEATKKPGIVASAGSTGKAYHVATNGKRTQMRDALAARARAAREGGSAEFK